MAWKTPASSPLEGDVRALDAPSGRGRSCLSGPASVRPALPRAIQRCTCGRRVAANGTVDLQNDASLVVTSAFCVFM